MRGLDATDAELRAAWARLRDLERLTLDWSWEVDRDLWFTHVGPRVLEVLGFHPIELLDRPSRNILGDSTPMVTGHAAAQARPFRDHEVTATTRLGDQRRLLLAAVPIFDEADGRFRGYRGLARDVTDARRREQELREAKAAAETANRAKSEFLATVSHELRTPLNAIIGFAEIMQAEHFGPLGSDRYRTYADDIVGSARHLSGLVTDLLNAAKLEAGKLELNEERVYPDDVANEAIRLIQPRADAAGVMLGLSPYPSDAELRADRQKLLQILLNLLSNAVKFTHADGRVTLSAGRARDGSYVFTVADTGVGMNTEEQATALEPFGQVDGPLAHTNHGTGLGLPLAKAFTELHEGTLAVESAPGAGTRITVTLPAERVGPLA
jgi:PAS domain S-box-containing protein